VIEGYIATDGGLKCQTDICGAVCCRSAHFRPDREPPCEYLTDHLTCELHDVGGKACKPLGCAEYPRSQVDIDMINELAEQGGFAERCLLRFA